MYIEPIKSGFYVRIDYYKVFIFNLSSYSLELNLFKYN